MDLSKIIAISGYPGLFIVVAQAHNGIIVESLIDKKRMQAFSTFKISALDDISIFTTGDDMPLRDVLTKMRDSEKGEVSLGEKAGNEDLKAYLKKVLPEYDESRVHVSDIKKLINWYNLLHKNDLLKDTEAEVKPEETADKAAEEKPKVKKAAAKTATKAKPDNSAKAANSKGARKTTTVRKTGA